jgi:hypothetical protein
VEHGFIYRHVNTNFFQNLNIPNGGGFDIYFAALVRGDDIGTEDTPDGVMFRMNPTIEVEGSGGVTFRNTWGLDLANVGPPGIAMRINTADEWNGNLDSTANRAGGLGVTSASVKASDETTEFKNYQLIVFNFSISPSVQAFSYLMGGLFLRYGAIATISSVAHRYYFDEDGNEQYQSLDASRQICLYINGSSPATGLSIQDPEDASLLFGNLKANGIWFTNSAIDHASLWNAVKQNRANYTPPDYC